MDYRSTERIISGTLPAGLLEHVKHVCLEDVVNGLDADPSPALRHGEDVDDPYGVVVDELAEHEAHDLHGHARPPCDRNHESVPQHERKRGGKRRRALTLGSRGRGRGREGGSTHRA